MDCGVWAGLYLLKDTIINTWDKWHGNTLPPSRQLETYIRRQHLEYKRQQKVKFNESSR